MKNRKRYRCRHLFLLSLLLLSMDLYMIRNDQGQMIVELVFYLHAWVIPIHRFVIKRNKRHQEELQIQKAEQ
jgi:hypothetical protein